MKTNGKATVEDGDDDEDMEAGPEMPPEEEDEKGLEDEEEGSSGVASPGIPRMCWTSWRSKTKMIQ